jgi:hypothetical protein
MIRQKIKKLFVGLFSSWPSIYFLLLFVMIIISRDTARDMMENLDTLNLFTCLLVIFLTGTYIFYIFKSKYVPKDKKALWVAIIFFANIFAFPVFWYLYIWRRDKGQLFTEENGIIV